MTTRRPVVESEPAWGRSDRLYRPDLPLFWLTIGLIGAGALLLNARLAPALNIAPGAASLALVLWGLYVVPFVLLVAALDLLEPEPPAFLASAFVWGAVVATSIAIVANGASQSILVKVAGADFARTWWAALSGPTVEEAIKALGVVVIVLVARRQVTTVLDGLVYGIFVGLGFQVAENLVYTGDRLRLVAFGGAPGRVVWEVFVLRGAALGLWSHAVYTGLLGFGIAFAVLRTDLGAVKRALVLLATAASAWLLHFLWNAPFTQPGAVGDGLLPARDLVLYTVKGLPALTLILVVVALARRREVQWFRDALRTEQAYVSPVEVDVLTSPRLRRAARTRARRRAGRRAASSVRRLQVRQSRLAVAAALARDGDDPSVRRARAAVEAARREVELWSLGSGSADVYGDPAGSPGQGEAR